VAVDPAVAVTFGTDEVELHDALQRGVVEPAAWVVAVITGVDVEICDIEQQAATRGLHDAVEKFTLAHFRTRQTDMNVMFSRISGTGIDRRAVSTLRRTASTASCVNGSGVRWPISMPLRA